MNGHGILDSAFLTCCIVNVNGEVSSFKVDSNQKVVRAFRSFSLNCGFGFGVAKNSHAFAVRTGDSGWSITATSFGCSDSDVDGVFSATGRIPEEVLEMIGEGKKAEHKAFVKDHQVWSGSPFAEPIEFGSKTKAKKFAKKHMRELKKEHDAWEF